MNSSYFHTQNKKKPIVDYGNGTTILNKVEFYPLLVNGLDNIVVTIGFNSAEQILYSYSKNNGDNFSDYINLNALTNLSLYRGLGLLAQGHPRFLNIVKYHSKYYACFICPIYNNNTQYGIILEIGNESNHRINAIASDAYSLTESASVIQGNVNTTNDIDKLSYLTIDYDTVKYSDYLPGSTNLSEEYSENYKYTWCSSLIDIEGSSKKPLVVSNLKWMTFMKPYVNIGSQDQPTYQNYYGNGYIFNGFLPELQGLFSYNKFPKTTPYEIRYVIKTNEDFTNSNNEKCYTYVGIGSVYQKTSTPTTNIHFTIKIPTLSTYLSDNNCLQERTDFVPQFIGSGIPSLVLNSFNNSSVLFMTTRPIALSNNKFMMVYYMETTRPYYYAITVTDDYGITNQIIKYSSIAYGDSTTWYQATGSNSIYVNLNNRVFSIQQQQGSAKSRIIAADDWLN